MSTSRRQRGIAIITALLVVALSSIAAVAVASAGFRALSRAQLLLDSERAWWYAQGMEAWALSILEREGEQSETDHLGEVWATQLPPLPVEGGVLQGGIEDAQGRFNLNNLGVADEASRNRQAAIFLRLMECTGLEVPFSPQEIINAIIDWVDSDDEQRFPGGGEDLLYLDRTPPHRAANQPFVSVSELAVVEGIDRDMLRALAPHLSALPEPTPININTATPQVLCALSDNNDFRGRIDSFVAARREAPLDSPTAAFAVGALFAPGDETVQSADISVESRYFLTRAEAFIGNGSAVLYSLVARGAAGAAPVVLYRSATPL